MKSKAGWGGGLWCTSYLGTPYVFIHLYSMNLLKGQTRCCVSIQNCLNNIQGGNQSSNSKSKGGSWVGNADEPSPDLCSRLSPHSHFKKTIFSSQGSNQKWLWMRKIHLNGWIRSWQIVISSNMFAIYLRGFPKTAGSQIYYEHIWSKDWEERNIYKAWNRMVFFQTKQRDCPDHHQRPSDGFYHHQKWGRCYNVRQSSRLGWSQCQPIRHSLEGTNERGYVISKVI